LLPGSKDFGSKSLRRNGKIFVTKIFIPGRKAINYRS
jgi:hypothetical protein